MYFFKILNIVMVIGLKNGIIKKRFICGDFMNYEEMFEFVRKTLEDADSLYSKKYSFRNRFEHIKRVFNWCERILPDYPLCNKEVCLTSCIFHDVGYAKGKENHANESAKIFINYAVEHKFDYEFTMEVANNISLHSNKELLNDKSTSEELILLLEADLLDEEGAIGIAWDLLGEGAKNPTSYKNGLDCIYEHSAHILNQEYMITPLAKKYWEDKKAFVKRFIEELRKDLFISEQKEEQ